MRTAQSTFGWTVINRDELRSVDQWLADEEQGVRDELGFLIIHQRFADRFFPGTSTQQRRLRYVLFVPWIYNEADQQPPKVNRQEFIHQSFLQLTRKLLKCNESGIIGGKIYPRPPSIPQDTIYWSALRAWNVLQPIGNDGTPSCAEAVRYLESTKHRHTRISEELDASSEYQHLFCTLPASNPIDHLAKSGGLSFRITGEEKRWLRAKLCLVKRGGDSSRQSLLGRLVENGMSVEEVEFPWDSRVLNVADEMDKRALAVARQAAGLVAIGRGVYGALVEQARRKDGLPKSVLPFDALTEAWDSYASEAAKTDLSELKEWIGEMPPLLEKVLQVTLDWLPSGDLQKFGTLLPHYAGAELDRKGSQRARLGRSTESRERRKDWKPETKAEPLHYRWPLVRIFLTDLRR